MREVKANQVSSKVILLKNRIKNSRGFILIELMVTVAIVEILAAVALPAYQDYVARSQVSEGLTLVSGAKPVIAEYYSNHGSYPSASDIGFNVYVSSYVGSTTIGVDGAIVATFSNDAHRQLRGQTVTLTPEEVEETGNLRWSCGSSVASKYLPTSCVNDGSSGNPGNGGTDPSGEDPGAVTPPGPPVPFDGNAYYGYNGIKYENGVLSGSGINGTLRGTDENGNIVYDTVGPPGTFTITPDGLMIWNMTNIATIVASAAASTADAVSGANDIVEMSYINYTNSSGQQVRTKVPTYNSLNGTLPGIRVAETSYSTTNPALSLSSGSAFNQAAINFNSTPNATTAAAYQDAINNFKSSLDTIKANNGGSYPADLPSIYSALYDQF